MTVHSGKVFKMAKLDCCFGQMGWRKNKKVIQDSSERFDHITLENQIRIEGSVKHVRSGEMKAMSDKWSWRFPGSPESVMSHLSTDRMMLKMHSLSRNLFSRSKELSCWKSFLRNHRNLIHKPWKVKSHSQGEGAGSNQNGGYTSKTLEPNKATIRGEMRSPDRSFTGKALNIDHNSQSRNDFQDGCSGIFPLNQSVAFSMEPSPLKRVDKWVKDLQARAHDHFEYDDNTDGSIIFLPSPDTGKSSGRSIGYSVSRQDNLFQDIIILHANSLLQSLNSSSTVARLSSMGLRSIPTISSFRRLRSVNLLNNKIAHITPRSLPKGLHTLNLSRNKISTIEGLRELTRLRILDLSYNHICRIAQGLSNCTKITELYLAGNKIRVVEGLHRLGKLTVLDLSFNKITITKALEQLVANYNSLKALNILGNPVQTNTSKDQVQKAVSGTLLKLVYLNKKPIKPQRTREVIGDAVAKAAIASRKRISARKAVRKVSPTEPSSSVYGSRVNSKQKSRIRSKTLLSSSHASTSGSLNKR